MKHYKDFEKIFIGCSDVACLAIVGSVDNPYQPIQANILSFGGDNTYRAYIIDEETKIPEHYKLITEFKSWLKIYDDTELVKTFEARKINIYRSGAYGCIIQLIN